MADVPSFLYPPYSPRVTKPPQQPCNLCSMPSFQYPEYLPRYGPGTVCLGTLWCSPSPATKSTLCQSRHSPPPMHCSSSIVPMQWMEDSIHPSPRSPSSARFKTHLNTQRLEGTAQCPGSTKPGLFLTRHPGQSLQHIPFLQDAAG